MDALFQAIIDHVPAPVVDTEGPFQMQISQLDYNSFLGVIGIGRITRGRSSQHRWWPSATTAASATAAS